MKLDDFYSIYLALIWIQRSTYVFFIVSMEIGYDSNVLSVNFTLDVWAHVWPMDGLVNDIKRVWIEWLGLTLLTIVWRVIVDLFFDGKR